MLQHWTQAKNEQETSSRTYCRIIIQNDYVDTFDWVIECLIEVCHHSPEQAEQCAWLVHYKGKYAVLHGSETELLPVCSCLLDRGLSAEIA
jgi:Uncharacterized conserved protein